MYVLDCWYRILTPTVLRAFRNVLVSKAGNKSSYLFLFFKTPDLNRGRLGL